MAIGKRLAILAILLLACGLRFYRLDAQSFWNDEGNSARLSERSIPLIIEGTASDVHPPLYYLMLRGWRELLGEHEFGLRSLSAFAGVLTVGVTMALGKVIGNRLPVNGGRLGMVAGFLTAVHPALIYYSQETRMYALLGLWAVLATWLLLKWRVASGEWRVVSGYVLCLVGGLYTHYFFPAVLLAHGLIVLSARPFRRSSASLLKWLGLVAAAVILYIPWLPIFLRQTGDRPDTDITLLHFLREAGNWLAFGETLPVGWGLWLVVGLVSLGVWHGRFRSRISLIATFIPLLFMFAAGSIAPQFYKFLVTAVPFFCLLIGFAICGLGFSPSPHPSPSRAREPDSLPLPGGGLGWGFLRFALYVFLFTAYCFLITRSLQNLYTNPAYARADYRSLAARIEAENHPNAGIILDAPNQWEVFTYYHGEGAPVYPLPTGLSQPTPAGIDEKLSEIASQHDRLYAIFWGETQRDPERLVERWLDEHAFKATDEWVGDVRFVTYAVPDEAAMAMETAVHLPFGDRITLNGYTLNGDQFAPGDIVQVTLFWQTAAPLDRRYKVFLHLVDASGQPIAQRDSEPGGGLHITTIWQPGEVIIDNHGLLIPADMPPGEYTVLLGLYDIADPTARLPITTNEGIDGVISLVTFRLRTEVGG